MIDKRVNNDFYTPIRPMPKNRNTNVQLRLCYNPLDTMGFPWRSFLRVDVVYKVPLEILEEELSFGRHLQLQDGLIVAYYTSCDREESFDNYI